MNKLARLLHKHFGTNQSNFLEQQKDGSYRKKSGEASVKRIEQMLDQGASIAILQRNKDASVNWICFDFDILKDALNGDMLARAEKELTECVRNFCQYLDGQGISYLLEFSGNRGFHIWITFDSPLAYWTAYAFQQDVLRKANIRFDEKLIALDLFPRSHNPSGGVGSGVKIPLSLHAKSGMYARLLASSDSIFGELKTNELSKALINENVEILSAHKGLTRLTIESLTGKSIELENHDEDLSGTARINEIKIAKPFELGDLLKHWSETPELEVLANRISKDKILNTADRKLLVGLLSSISAATGFSYESVLHQIFKQIENYDQAKTAKAISALSSFHFPSKHQIEKVVGRDFPADLSLLDLIKCCVPNYESHLDVTFKLSEKDIDVARLAELNYIRTNDEVHAKKVANSLGAIGGVRDLYVEAINLLSRPDKAKFYVHERQEPSKVRKLVTLEAAERVVSSAAMKQIIHYFDLKESTNSYGYNVNRGFKGGHIFEPWLMRWIEFTANIGTALGDTEYSNFYIVKSDVRSFYDEIPHDNIKRVLLEGVSPDMKTKLQQLPGEAAADYRQLIDLLFGITKRVVEKSVGLPQGPAYARWLAELYISSLDDQFDQLIETESVFFYQRFVDDIFFITSDEASAKNVLQQMRTSLEALGLQINDEKTICKKIRDFTPDFDQYRSQSKYAVDKVSRNFDDATEGEKNNAIEEFLKLVQSDTCNDDLSFIFSHLTGVEMLDKWKRQKVLPVLSSMQGRGSLFRHLFHFVLDDENSWGLLQQIDSFSGLQSEVFSEALLDYMHEHKSNRDRALALLDDLGSKISRTPLTLEHLAFISLYYGHPVDAAFLPPKNIVEALRHIENASLLQIPAGLVNYVNTELNGIEDLAQFIHVMYCLCAAPNIDSVDLNGLAKTFFAKISYEERTGGIAISERERSLSMASLAKLHYLICLFSVSKAGSVELVKTAWKYCLALCNEVKTENFDAYSDDWLRKIEGIEIDNSRVLLIISSIVDGNLVRGTDDKCRLFERYHSALLVFFALGARKFNFDEISEVLEELAKKATFYAWLTSRTDVAIFPNSNKPWFDKNLIENDVILLKKGEELLIRRPTDDFLPISSPVNNHLGFSELVIPYDLAELTSLKNIIDGLQLNGQLKLLCDLLDEGGKRGSYPNFFQQDPMIDKASHRSVSQEFDGTRKIVFEEIGGDVTVGPNDKATFIRSFLQMGRSSKTGISLLRIDSKYVRNLEGDAQKFLSSMRGQLEELGNLEDEFTIDLAASSAIYSLLDNGDEDIFKLRRFVNQYHKFHPNPMDRVIYAFDENTKLVDDSPLSLLETVAYSLSLIRDSGYETLLLYIDKDVQDYKTRLESIASSCDDDLSLASFQKASVKILNLGEILNVNGVDYEFDKVGLIHSASNCLKVFTADYSTYVSSSEHTYFTTVGDKNYLLAVDPVITKCFRSIQERMKPLLGKSPVRSFPASPKKNVEYEKIDRWAQAVDILQEHRDVTRSEASHLLGKWLNYLPEKFHVKLVALVASHEVMTYSDREGFLNKVEALIDSSECAFWLKDPEDFNGTQRLLYSRPSIGRNIRGLSPIDISGNPEVAVVVVDILLSGSQTARALKYYLSPDGSDFVDGCYKLNEADQKNLAARFGGLSRIRICCVLYTPEAIGFLQTKISSLLGRTIVVDVVHGRDIGGNAFFETTEKIGMAEKVGLSEFLLDKEVQIIFDRLFFRRKGAGKVGLETLGRTNLVARYKSVPKKCFWFLPTGLRANNDCSALVRIAEVKK